MKGVFYSKEKNALIKENRGIGFEDVEEAVKTNRVIRILKHPNRNKYKDQKYMIVNINNYAYIVPYKETKEGIVWITIFASRKYTKKYIKIV